jgi:hypothetical protein
VHLDGPAQAVGAARPRFLFGVVEDLADRVAEELRAGPGARAAELVEGEDGDGGVHQESGGQESRVGRHRGSF